MHNMIFLKNLFTSVKEWNDSVKLGDDKELSVKGSGSMQIKIYDGMVRMLDAWHVLDLRKILISLDTFDRQGYNYFSRDGQIKISKGTLTIIKDKLQHGIYTLIGNLVMGIVQYLML
jgi:hypothetical protein